MERLDKFIASQTGMTRKEARTTIWKGCVSVNGATEKSIDRKVDPDKDAVLLDGKEVCYRQYLYIMMNKPEGYVSATRDREERTVLELLPEDKRDAAIGVLSHDPRPSYQRKPDRIYGLTFAGFDIRFKVADDVLTVEEVKQI